MSNLNKIKKKAILAIQKIKTLPEKISVEKTPVLIGVALTAITIAVLVSMGYAFYITGRASLLNDWSDKEEIIRAWGIFAGFEAIMFLTYSKIRSKIKEDEEENDNTGESENTESPFRLFR